MFRWERRVSEMEKQQLTYQQRYQCLYGLLYYLPDDGRWTQLERDEWAAVFQMVLDYITVLKAEEPPMIANHPAADRIGRGISDAAS